MEALRDALKDAGMKSTSEIIKQKVDALQKLYPFKDVIHQLITFALKRVSLVDLHANHTLSLFEKVFRDGGSLYNTKDFDDVYRNTLNFDRTTSQVFNPADIFTAAEIHYFITELPNRKLDEILSNLLDTIVIVGHEKENLYLSIPEDILIKGGVLEVVVPLNGPGILPMLIGKKGANIKRMVQYLTDIMADGNNMVVTKINFVELGWK